MTIGPLPMMRMDSMSVRRGISATLGHQVGELLEQIRRIVRPGTGFGMVLDGEDGLARQRQAFARPRR